MLGRAPPQQALFPFLGKHHRMGTRTRKIIGTQLQLKLEQQCLVESLVNIPNLAACNGLRYLLMPIYRPKVD